MAGQTSRGAWISYRAGDFDSVEVHSSEIKALRAAVQTQGATVFVHHGQLLKDAVAGKPAVAEGRIPGEDPLPIPDKQPAKKAAAKPKAD